MQKLWFKLCSMFLVIVTLFNMLPMTAWAEEYQEMTSSNISDFSSVSTGTNTQTEIAEAQIVGEVIENRTEYSKEFRLDNGLMVAAVYTQPVHYQEDGQWQEIDNTLVVAADGTLTNTAGIWNVSFPQQLSKTNPVTITKDGYTLSFVMAGELRNQGNLEVMSVGEEAAAASVSSNEESASFDGVGSETALETASVTIDGSVQTFAVASAQTSVGDVQTIDLTEAKAAAKYEELVVEKNASQLLYANVYSNTNVQYDLQGNKVKESIILNTYDSNLRGYRYTLNVGDMIPVLYSDGSIEFYDAQQENIVMFMPAPYLVDAAKEHNFDIHVNLTGGNGVYTLTYILPTSWLASSERQWPVVLDPVVNAYSSISNIEDQTVMSAKEYSHNWGCLQIGQSATSGVCRPYVKYRTLPNISSSDVILNATLKLKNPNNGSSHFLTTVHKVKQTWDVSTLQWDNKPDYEEMAEDYAIVIGQGWYSWDVTDIVRGWYDGQNTGFMIKASDANEALGPGAYKQFYSSDWGAMDELPSLVIEYKNSNGIEDYWNYTSASAGRAGTGSVNTYTGNMTWVRSDLGFSGNLMPVSISHVYNLSDAASNTFGLGYGWRTNFHELITSTTINDSKYYIWEDGDGTKHYFKNIDYGVFVDEDNLQLTLNSVNVSTDTDVSSGQYSITDKSGNIRVFDSKGRLIRLINNQDEKSSIAITYTTTSGFLINKITDGAGRVYDFTYTNDLLSRIDYYGTTAAATTPTSFAHVTFGYDTNSNLTSVTDKDGKSSTYSYNADNTSGTVDDHVLTVAQDIDGYKLQYTYYVPTEDYQTFRVKQVKEYSGSTVGGELNFEYAHNQTALIDHNENMEVIQFNNYGNVVSTQDGEGRARYTQYALNGVGETAGEGSTAKPNQLRLSSRLQNTVVNLFENSSFENGTSTGFAIQTISTSEAYLGSKSLTVSGQTLVQSGEISLPAGKTFTASVYVKTVGTRAAICIYGDTLLAVSTPAPADSDWTRIEASYTNDSSSEIAITVGLFCPDTGTAYFDCIQVEQAATASRYNLVQNGDFRTTSNWSASTGRTTFTSAAPQLSSNAYQMNGDPTAENRISQTITVSGVAGDNFVLAGWAKGDSVPLTEAEEGESQRQFALIGTFIYSDGSDSEEFIAQFNPDTNVADSWQYVAEDMVASKAYTGVKIELVYDYNLHTVYFDGIQLFKEQFGSSYTYNEDGEVVSVVDLQNKTTTYEYDANDNLTKILQDNKAKMTYEYDKWHNVIKATSEEGIVYEFEYDAWGNITAVWISSGDSKIKSEASYTADKNYISTAKDTVGNVTTYGYNTNTGALEWIQYPEDTAATRTEFSYDSMYRRAAEAVTTDTGAALTASYGYTDDMLTSLTTASTEYSFTYGAFSLQSSVKIGNRTLATYSYTNDRNKYLDTLAYGNGDSVQYTYDDHGRVTKQTYEDGGTVTYQYDNNGALATITDSATGIKTTYYYDFTDRLMKYVESGSNYSHSVGYEYDDINNLTKLVETINGVEHSTSYTYDEDNRIEAVSNGNTSKEYEYDSFGRIGKLTTKDGNTTVKTDGFTFNGHKTETAQTTGQIDTHTVTYGTTTKQYSYTYDNNGNIIQIKDGSSIVAKYTYDTANQLIREDNNVGGFTHVWTYDNAGNILSRKEYTYSDTAALGTLQKTVSYSYDTTSGWGDRLISYDGKTISYEATSSGYISGNIISDGTWNYTWEHGRQLASMSNGSATWNFTYNADGLRTKRTNGTTTYQYVYNGGSLSQMTVGANTLYFAYDASGTPMSVTYNNETYYYVTNIQGDVIAILNSSGTAVATYTYDAWGNPLNTVSSGIGALNPLRYRGYVYDTETGLYYLQSRYYNPTIGRFINADILVSTGQGLLGYNMFAYCLNNPILLCDRSGTCSYKSNLGGWIDCGSPNCQTSANYTTNSLYHILTHMGNPKNHGGTFSVGASIGGTVYNYSQGLSVCLSVDPSNNYAFQKTENYGAASGAGGSAAIVLTWTNASNVQDLAGTSESTGFTFCSAYGLSIDYITFVPASQPNSQCWGVSIAISGGGEVEVHKNYNYTTSTRSWNLWHSIRDVLFGGQKGG